jgi:hypothetical protein
MTYSTTRFFECFYHEVDWSLHIATGRWNRGFPSIAQSLSIFIAQAVHEIFGNQRFIHLNSMVDGGKKIKIYASSIIM